MRTFVFLLILANLLFFVWSGDYLGFNRNPHAHRIQQQLLADQVRIVSNNAPPGDPVKADKTVKPAPPPPAEKPPVEICVQLNDIPAADAEQLESTFAEKLPMFKIMRTTTSGTSNYWVHIPPAKTKRDAEDSAAELRQLGIQEYFIVQENGPNNLAISLGLFSTKESAVSALEIFHNQGVRQAKVTERVVKPAISQMEIRGPEGRIEEMNRAIAQRAKDARRGTCKSRPS